MADILFKTGQYLFSLRAAGVCVQQGRVLLQTSSDGSGYAFPGGHVSFGETQAQSLEREFWEELGARVAVGPLRWVAEILYPRKGRTCQQICSFFDVDILSPSLPLEGDFTGREAGRDIAFHWVPLERLPGLRVYPREAVPLLLGQEKGFRHLISREG